MFRKLKLISRPNSCRVSFISDSEALRQAGQDGERIVEQEKEHNAMLIVLIPNYRLGEVALARWIFRELASPSVYF